MRFGPKSHPRSGFSMRREKFINHNKIRIITLGGKKERGLWGESELINKRLGVHYDFSGTTGKDRR